MSRWPIGIEVLVGVELVPHVAFESLGVGLAVEGPFPGKRVPETHNPGGPPPLRDALVNAHDVACLSTYPKPCKTNAHGTVSSVSVP